MALPVDAIPGQEEPIESPWLDEAIVTGFQGFRDFSIKFSSGANFLIGKNGCGKTTLINMINAGLNGEAASLFRARFKSLELILTFGPESSRYTLLYDKISTDDFPGRAIKFSIIGPRGGNIYNYTIYDRERYAYRGSPERIYFEGSPPFDIDYALNRSKRRKPVTTWLSILRSDPVRSPSPENAWQNPIDRKLEELTKRISSYLSALDSRASERSAKFQKDYFLSLIGYKGGDAFGKATAAFNKLNLDTEQDNLGKILAHLGLGQLDYVHKLKSHFDDARKVPKDSATYTLQDALKISDTLRIHELNEKWLAFENDRAKVYELKNVFIETVNGLLDTKTLTFNDRNQPAFFIDKNRRITIPDLSSGEKQLFIILSEALVQEGKRAIYLADEPELSLHIEWQQFLVDNILQLNKQCQIIFATHSPDILGRYGNNAKDVERL